MNIAEYWIIFQLISKDMEVNMEDIPAMLEKKLSTLTEERKRVCFDWQPNKWVWFSLLSSCDSVIQSFFAYNKGMISELISKCDGTRCKKHEWMIMPRLKEVFQSIIFFLISITRGDKKR